MSGIINTLSPLDEIQLLGDSSEVSTKWGCVTKALMAHVNFTWVINDFEYRMSEYATGICMISSPFFSNNSARKVRWQMRVYPTGKSETHKEFVTVTIISKVPEEKGEVKPFHVKYDLAFYDKCKELKCQCSGSNKFCQDGYGHGFNLVCHKDMKNLLGEDGSLTIDCKIQYQYQEANQSCFNLDQMEQIAERAAGKREFNLKSFFVQDYLSDITIQVGGHTFPAHKMALANRSEVFNAMFTHDFKENRENQLTIEDIEPIVFREFLRFIYTNRVEDMAKHSTVLLILADKYCVEALKILCEKFMIDNISIENCCEMSKLAELHSAPSLRNASVNYIRLNEFLVRKTPGWSQYFVPQLCASVKR